MNGVLGLYVLMALFTIVFVAATLCKLGGI